jgi:nicotinamide mononucleotide transporter
MNYWDWIALITGVLGVILTIKQKIIAWPMALISICISIIAFYKARLFGDMFLNIFYFFSGIYGWYLWENKKNEVFKASYITKKMAIAMIFITSIQFILYYLILTYFKSDQILVEALLTACSFTCTIMMIKKWVENWVFWVIIDLSYVFLYIIKEMPAYALLYFIFAGIAGYGYYTWRTELKKLPS